MTRVTAPYSPAGRPALLGAAAVVLALMAVSCGCSADRKGEPSAPGPAPSAGAGFETWGASFSLPDGWTGGENDAGGIELTDGELALMVGRHELDSGQSLESFLAGRRVALEEMGALTNVETTEQRAGTASTLQLRARSAVDAGGIHLRLLVARLGPNAGISLLMVGDGGAASRIDPAWTRLVESLRLP